MTVSVEGDVIFLRGACGLDDVEPLLQALLDRPGAEVDWSGCETAHAAVLQLLMLARRPLRGPPSGEALKFWAEPSLLAER